MVNEAVSKLAAYALQTGLIEENEYTWAVNSILDTLKIDSCAAAQKDWGHIELAPVLEELLDDAHRRGVLAEASVVYRDLFDTELMGRLTPRPAQVIQRFQALYAQDPKAATVKLHDGYSFQMPLRAPYSGEVILSARPEQLFFSEKGIPGKVNLSVFLGDFIQYEVQLHTGQVLELNEYTKDVDSAKADGEEVHISFNPRRVSLYRKDTEEVLSC